MGGDPLIYIVCCEAFACSGVGAHPFPRKSSYTFVMPNEYNVVACEAV